LIWMINYEKTGPINEVTRDVNLKEGK